MLPPRGAIERRAGADVADDEGLGTDAPHELHVPVRPEGVVLDDAAPDDVDHAGSLRAGGDAVAPVVVVGEAAAGPTDIGDADAAEGVNDVIAQVPCGVGAAGAARPHAVVDAAAEVLHELPEDMAADGVARL